MSEQPNEWKADTAYMGADGLDEVVTISLPAESAKAIEDHLASIAMQLRKGGVAR